ncbi:MAG TPA: nuclear transport factor 2 family protein [Acidimicrobiales bacterium]|jgi:ketosteroid isomerase-like protein|nr:nuclear transport factor 2 family protein [Acidimicrobiales bacterium]
MADTDERNRQIVLDWLDAYCTFDPAKYEHLLADDPHYRVMRNEYHGRAGFAEIARIARHFYPNGMKREILAMLVDGNHVAVRLVNRAVTNAGHDYENHYAVFFDIPPTMGESSGSTSTSTPRTRTSGSRTRVCNETARRNSSYAWAAVTPEPKRRSCPAGAPVSASCSIVISPLTNT